MKIQHYAIIFIIIILPFSIICKTKMNNKVDALNDETRINNAIDTATLDATERLIELNNEYYNLSEGQVIKVTPAVAQNAIDVFFESLSVNFNLPFVEGDFNKDYFSPYIPAIIVVAYDGFYIYSVENGKYVLSPKIPYSYKDGEWLMNFTLGNYIKLYAPNGILYKGEFQKDFINEASGDYNEFASILGDSTIQYLPQLTTDMSMIVYALKASEYAVPSFLSDDTSISIKSDYSPEKTEAEVSEFHKIRREAIIETIIEALDEKINNHNRYADMMGVTYDFYLPTIPNADWINAVDDVSIMAFVQGIPVGPDSYYNSYALGASRIIRTDYLYGVVRSGDGGTYYIYHEKDCEYIDDFFDEDGNLIQNVDDEGNLEYDGR